MIDNNFIIKFSKVPLGNGLDDGLQEYIFSNPQPHFTANTVVFKPQSTSTKWRITWDRTRHTHRTGQTINNLLMSGNPQYTLMRTIIGWRLKAFVAITDIRKLFNRIMLKHTFGYKRNSAVAKATLQELHKLKPDLPKILEDHGFQTKGWAHSGSPLTLPCQHTYRVSMKKCAAA